MYNFIRAQTTWNFGQSIP